jgi:hypothetical protein
LMRQRRVKRLIAIGRTLKAVKKECEFLWEGSNIEVRANDAVNPDEAFLINRGTEKGVKIKNLGLGDD